MKEIQVPQDEEFISATKEYNHSTYGMGPCIGVGIYNKKTGESYLAHMAYVYKDFEKDIQTISEKLGPKDTQIYICGGAHSQFQNQEGKEYTNEARSFIKKTLENYFPKKNIKVKWNKLDFTSDLVINKKSKKFEHKVYNLFGDYDDQNILQEYEYKDDFSFF